MTPNAKLLVGFMSAVVIMTGVFHTISWQEQENYTKDVLVAKTASKDIYQENSEKTAQDLQTLKDSLEDGDEYSQDGDHVVVRRKNGQVEKYEVVHGIAGDSLIRTK